MSHLPQRRTLALLFLLYMAQGLPFGFQKELSSFLRETGVSLDKIGFTRALSAPWMAKALDGTKSPTVYADDVRRGYRVDVYRAKTNKWYSLVARGGAYSVGAKSFAPGDAEGYVKSSGGTSEVGETGPTARLYVHEALFGWDGWSLAARRPGKTIVDPLGKTDDVANAPALGVPVSTEWRVTPGTLPKLRYGEHYRFRARVVDLAGNSLPFSDATSSVMPAEAPSDLVRYERHEPIAAPALVPQRRFGEGESLERLVIRGDRDVPAEADGSGLTLRLSWSLFERSVQVTLRLGNRELATICEEGAVWLRADASPERPALWGDFEQGGARGRLTVEVQPTLKIHWSILDI